MYIQKSHVITSYRLFGECGSLLTYIGPPALVLDVRSESENEEVRKCSKLWKRQRREVREPSIPIYVRIPKNSSPGGVRIHATPKISEYSHKHHIISSL